MVFIAGANGIGKSTFLKQISGSLPSRGSICIDEKTVASYSLKERALRIGFLEQQHPIYFPLTVKDLVVMGRYAHKASLESYSTEDYAQVALVLEELGVAYLYDKNFLNLSGGEQQLCLLAQLALQNPDIILLDEPTQSLDLHNKERIFDWMEKQVNEKGKIVLCVTHDLHWITKKKGYLLPMSNSTIELLPLSEALVLETIDKLKRQAL
ncbi:MAG: transporter ATP-binding protein [Cytophagaceae bacterium]|jgi:iron complex transport system ATP-binding protein|nr:transporter ATP-binding protein [Cytophagaceae bacterium]